ncbi:MAG: glycosyltransferase family 39 protein [Methanobrevibacter sp.]|jgi:uncharacterized membrane protein|nr:glycosyltransferase family 39 protein [Candidatus Methanovirga basalitermitum]
MNFKNIIGVFLAYFSIFLLIILLRFGINQAFFSQDEQYTFYLVSLSFKDIIYITATDVHPPLYYCLLKLFLMVFPFDVILAKLFSVIPLILLICFSFMKIRKDSDWLTTGIFIFSLVTMSKILYYSLQVRMYSWAMFFVFLSFYYFYKIIKKSTKKNWIIFTIFSLLSAYTHYYGAIAICFLFLFLLVHVVFKNRKFFKNWVLSSIVTLLIYCPWIYFFSMSKYLTSSEWGVPSFENVLDVVGFIFSPITDVFNHRNLDIYGIGLFIVIMVLFLFLSYQDVKKRMKGNCPNFLDSPINDMIVIYGFGCFIGVLFFGLIFSFLVKPMFDARYLFVVLVCFWLSFSILLSKSYKYKMIFVPIFIIVLFSGVVNSVYFVDCKNYEEMTDLQFKNAIGNLTRNDTVVYLGPSFMVDKFKFSFHLENDFILYSNDTSISSVKENVQVYVFDCGDLKNTNLIIDDFNRSMIENGFKLNKLGSINRCYPAYPRCVYELID